MLARKNDVSEEIVEAPDVGWGTKNGGWGTLTETGDGAGR